MISLPGLFLALSGAAMVAALVALWNSVRGAFGGGPGVLVETARDLPDHAQLVEEKHSLLRAIKDLEYERAVGKIGDADFERLDTAYRARAKQVLSQLDRDVKPLYEEAERLIAARRGASAAADPAAVDPAAVDPAAVDPAAEQTARPKMRKGAKVSSAPPPSGEPVTETAVTESAAATEPGAPEEGPSMDDVLAGIRDGSITEAPAPPAHWPSDAKKMWTSTLERALADQKNKDVPA